MFAAQCKAKSDQMIDSIVEDVVAKAKNDCMKQASTGAYSYDFRLQDMPTQGAALSDLKRKVVVRLVAEGFVLERSPKSRVDFVLTWRDAKSTADSSGNLRGCCSICLDSALLRVLVPCGHSVCAACNEKCSKTCSTCRRVVALSIPVFVDPNGAEKPSKRPRINEGAQAWLDEISGKPTNLPEVG
mmetsp:Transcript_71374/g.190241  ORF Transcript_71374/g.190241 Transcript_71374/m.190241 type:complete len:186 (+) Transcript_71374:48-605(+)